MRGQDKQTEHTDPKPPQKPRPIIYPDADPHNANWLRLLAQRRQQEQEAKAKAKAKQKENPTDGDIQ